MSDGRCLEEILHSHALWLEGVQTAFRGILENETLNGVPLQSRILKGFIIRGTALLDAICRKRT